MQAAGFADTDAFADDAVSDTTVPNWRLQVEGAPQLRAQYAKWFDYPAELSEVRRTPLLYGELLEYTRSWTQKASPTAATTSTGSRSPVTGSSRTRTGAGAGGRSRC